MKPVATMPYKTFGTLAVLLLSAGSSHGALGIVSLMGADEIPAPPSVASGMTESFRPVIFQEAAGLRLTASVRVDHLNNGNSVIAIPTISGNVINPLLNPGQINADPLNPVTVDSFLFHFDPNGRPLLRPYISVIEFASPVIGVQLFSKLFPLVDGMASYVGTLESGDALFSGDRTYPVAGDPLAAGRGVEEDAFVFVVSGNRVLLAGNVAGAGIDQVRIFTAGQLVPNAVVPELSSMAGWTLLIGVAGALGVRRSRQAKLSAAF